MNTARHLARRLLRAPLFTAITLLTLAIGIGANSAIFSVIHGVLLKSLPYPNPDRLVGVWATAPGVNIKQVNASPAMYFTYREESRTFQDIGMWNGCTVSVTGLAEPEEVRCVGMTEGVLPILGVQPMIGRGFTKKDATEGNPETVLLTYGYWQRHFGGNPAALGQRLMADGTAREIIGVLPRDFQFMDNRAQLVLPFQLNRSKVFLGNFSYQAVARLKDGVTLAQANADVARMLPMMLAKFPPFQGMSVKMFEQARFAPDVHLLKEDVVGDIGPVLWVLMGTVGIVLLIACANVANLLLVRAEGRQHELAIRAALGAGGWQVARELLAESLSLGLIGGVLGLGLAAAGLRLLVSLAPGNLPRMEEISIDPAVLAFTLAISVFAGILFGLIPVFKYAGPRLAGTLSQNGRTGTGKERHRARAVLVVVQVAMALVLLVSAGLMIRTLEAIRQVQPGFHDGASLETMRVSVPTAQVKEREQVARTFDRIIHKIEALPGVRSAAIANGIPMDPNRWQDPVFAEDRTYREGELAPLRRYRFVSPGYFGTMGISLVAGRDLTWTDIWEKRPFVLVSENLAREMWGSAGKALGKRVRERTGAIWREVIGVVGDTRDDGLTAKAPTVIYWPFYTPGIWDSPETVQRDMAFVIRSPRSGSESLFKEIEQTVWSANPNLTIANAGTVQDLVDKSNARTSFTLVMLTLAATMALLLGIIGIYGVISYSISQRTREIGVRMALGASQFTVRHMFVRHALAITAIGVAIGLGGAIALTRMMTSLLFGVNALDPITYGAVAVVLTGAALVAGYLPARRATLIEPMNALRAE